MEPDIVLLREAGKRLPALPLGLVARAGFASLGGDLRTPSIAHHGNAILLRAGRPAPRIEPLGLAGSGLRGGHLAGSREPFATTTVGSLHPHLRHAVRRRQIARAIEAARGIAGPIVPGGGLPEWRTREGALP